VTLTRDSGIRLLTGLGIAVLPTYARAVAPASVLVRPLTEPSISRDIVVIRLGGRAASPALSAFEGLLRRFVRQLAPSEAG
jgi:DNA-binding transcriptional LysR family regulator